tara:strand:+ start:9056 stop:9661 length:606 start_codon:yes stop_codon:yes gene_type:complete
MENVQQKEYIVEVNPVILTEDLPMVDSVYIKENINKKQRVFGGENSKTSLSNDESKTAFKSKKIETKLDFDQSSTIWISEWLTSDSGSSEYGKGRFYYRFARSRSYVDKRGNYKYEVYFISDSYYNAGMYNGNAYRCATKIDEVGLYVNGQPYINDITGSGTFWIMFQGNFEQGIGDLRISFYNKNPNASVYITWSAPRPF